MFDPLDDLSDAALLHAIVEEERVAARAMGRQARLIAALHRREAMVPELPDAAGPELDREALVEAEIATALHVSARAASTRVEVALALTRRLPGTLTLLERGELDWYRARVVSEETTELAVAAAEAVWDSGGSPAAAERAALEVSRAVEGRVLARAPGQTAYGVRRSVARAVIAVDPGAAHRRHEKAALARRAALVPLPDAMAELCFTLPAPDAVAVWHRIDHRARAARGGGDPRTLDQLRADTLVDLVTGGGDEPGAATRRTKAHVLVTVAADTLLGLDDEPAHLDGFGPVPAQLARTIAARRDTTWRRLLTDPASGALLDHGRTTYTPPAALADHVIARDRTCTFPGCAVTAARCDLDHLVPFPIGPTAADNLHALCRRHHLLKHRGRWRVEADPDTAQQVWTSPVGQRRARALEPA